VLESDAGHDAVALDAYRRALAIYEREQGTDGVSTGHTIGLIGMIEDDLGHHDDAIRDLQRALDVAGRVYGKTHPNYANALSNLASHTYDTDHARALELSEQAHAIRLAALDPDHPELATSWSNLGGIKRSLGRLAEARDDLDKALAIKVRVLGADNPSVGVTHVNLSQVLFDLHDLPGSLDHATRAVAIFTKSLGDDHLYTATARAQLGVTLLELGRAAEAVAPLEAAIAHLGNDADLYRYQFDLADALAKSHGDPARSRALATTALATATQRKDTAAVAAIQKLLHGR
jgi:tetratricopeptide (TPR) repeat protein